MNPSSSCAPRSTAAPGEARPQGSDDKPDARAPKGRPATPQQAEAFALLLRAKARGGLADEAEAAGLPGADSALAGLAPNRAPAGPDLAKAPDTPAQAVRDPGRDIAVHAASQARLDSPMAPATAAPSPSTWDVMLPDGLGPGLQLRAVAQAQAAAAVPAGAAAWSLQFNAGRHEATALARQTHRLGERLRERGVNVHSLELGPGPSPQNDRDHDPA